MHSVSSSGTPAALISWVSSWGEDSVLVSNLSDCANVGEDYVGMSMDAPVMIFRAASTDHVIFSTLAEKGECGGG